jgi:hypothetical protein
MAGSNLTEEELRAAAAEAGISPAELKTALAERRGDLPARTNDVRSILGPPTRGGSVTHVEGRLGLTPSNALSAVRGAIERQTGKRGHKQGEGLADIVDEDAGVTYRLRSTDDGGDGAIVRVDVDATAAKGSQALATTGVVGVTTTLVALGWLFGATLLWMGGLGLGVVGGLLLVRSIARTHRAASQAHTIAAHALLEAEDKVQALPPAGR